MSEDLLPAQDAVDHLLLGVPNLEEGIAWVAEKTGVEAVFGGRHPGLGTHNALLSLGRKQYLEIIAPDPTQTTLAPQFAFLQLATAPRLLTWAAATKDIHDIAAQAHAAGFELSGPNHGSRTRPDGQTLRWKTLFLKNDFSLLIPFFIEWDAASRHPSEDSPTGCTLRAFEIETPQPETLRLAFRRLGLAANVARGNKARLRALLDAPRGIVELT
ncbi:MAG TPA: VOC family protein [Blastocatellia bacterium]|nr:VOC family protein [Blastocatellia bacterium]